eukprot:Seg1520.4 transcript_id=Seg1520.4/GoldUCD/mRNA.D3Y31 product="Phosphatidylinositol glycan anchor biosynthesis class U protein" protein_id=Seg1520.4/GoldUCD/D3Y31
MQKLFLISFAVRWIIIQTSFDESLKARVEVVTPLTGWNRLKECIALTQYGLSPYEGDICHHPPFMILLFKLLENLAENAIPYVFILCDLLGAFFLMKAAKEFIRKQLLKQGKDKAAKDDAKVLLWGTEDLESIPYFVTLIYLINPFTIVTCVAFSTGAVNNLVLCMTFYLLVADHHFMAAAFAAVVSYLSFYPVMLITPLTLKYLYDGNSPSWKKSIQIISAFAVSLSCLMVSSYKVLESWDFADAVYMFTLRVPDLTPNMGLFWYFFLEMFDHFRLFFLWILQLNAFIYVIPFSIIFRKKPEFLFYLLLATISWCKSYPAVGDLVMPLALLPLWKHCYRYFRSLFLAVVMLLFSTIMAPVLYHLWIYAGSGNANFFYATTLAFNLAQILLLSDAIYAHLRRDYHIKHGLNVLTENGEKGIIVMK